MTNTPILETKDLCFAYESLIVLRHINITVFPGESLSITGPNGCGKTTLFRILSGLDFPDKGTYYFHGNAITKEWLSNPLHERLLHQQIGYMFQDPDLQLFTGSVREEIAFGLYQMGYSSDKVMQRTEELLQLFSINDLADRAPYHLSGGEKRKVALACVLSLNPDILLLDEPMAGLDDSTQQLFFQIFKTLHQAGKTLLFATHDSSLIKDLSNRVIEITEKHNIL